MSGTNQFRPNKTWLNATQADVAPFRFFWELLNFVNDHTGLSFVAYGTSTTQTATGTPTAWLTWNTPPPMSDHAWFVFQADNASELLDGSGSYVWQAKVQVVNTSGVNFVDCSGVDYGLTTTDQIVAIRCSPHGGWDGPSTLDFDPVSTADASDNSIVFEEDGIDFNVHFAGDNDTISWFGIGGSIDYLRIRGCYLGMLTSADDETDDPFIMMVGEISTTARSSGNLASASKDSTTSHQFYTSLTDAEVPNVWPGFTLLSDGITGTTDYKLDAGGLYWNVFAGQYQYSTPAEDLGDGIVVSIREATNQFRPIGELRHLWAISSSYNEKILLGTNEEYIQISDTASSTSNGGIAWIWSPGLSPAF
jgi:hypothetical protein